MSFAGVGVGISVDIAFILLFSKTPFPYSDRGNYEDVTIMLERTMCFGA